MAFIALPTERTLHSAIRMSVGRFLPDEFDANRQWQPENLPGFDESQSPAKGVGKHYTFVVKSKAMHDVNHGNQWLVILVREML